MIIQTFFNSLDLPTLWFALGISALMQAGVWALISIIFFKYPGAKTAMIASLLIAFGIMLLPFQGKWPDFSTIVIANSLIVAGVAAYYTAVCQFTGRNVSLGFISSITFISFGALLSFTFIQPNTPARIIVLSLAIILLLSGAARVLIQSSRPEYKTGAQILLVLFIILSGVMFLRILFTLLNPTGSILISTSSQIAIIFSSLLVTYLALGGAMVMFGQRLRYDLNITNTQLEQRVEERTKDLETANRELEALVHTLAHDLRTPIRAMAGYSHLIEENISIQLDEESLHYLNRMKLGAKRMGQLIDELMNYMQLRRQPLHKQTINTTRLVKEVYADRLDTIDKTHKIKFFVGDLMPCSADPEMIRIVFDNLLENAIKYSAHRQEAFIEVGMGNDAYFVRDNGVGFEPQYAEKIFGIFERLHRIDEFEGTGIGLAIVKRIIERHSGRIWAEAVVDQGATFYFTLGE